MISRVYFFTHYFRWVLFFSLYYLILQILEYPVFYVSYPNHQMLILVCYHGLPLQKEVLYLIHLH